MNELAPTSAITTQKPASLLMDVEAFAHMQRVGAMLALSPLFPEHLRKGTKETAIANGVLVMNMAARLNEDPLTVAQNIYFVSGKPGWSAAYMIGKANQHGVFTGTISWEVSGTKEKGDLSVTAFAKLASTGQRVEATCDMAMAKAEGWTKNAKYQSMPEQMLSYRSATFLIRLYCPEVMVGIPSQVEVELGMKDVTPVQSAPSKTAPAPEATQSEIDTKENPDVTDAEEVEEAETESDDEDAKADDAEPESTKEEVKDPPKEGAKPPADEKKAEAKREPDHEQFQALASMIMRDLQEAGSVNDVLTLYAPQFEQLKESAPDTHAELMKQVEKARGGD